jgi:DNA transformation protein
MSEEFIDYVMELLGPFGTVRTRRMFGGHGVYLDGLMFALVLEDTLHLKADAMNCVEFEQAGCEIFSYLRKGKRATLNFYRAPEDAMESPELMLPWARSAYAAALRSNAKKLAAEQTRAGAKLAPPPKRTTPAKTAFKQAAKKMAGHPAKAGQRKPRAK